MKEKVFRGLIDATEFQKLIMDYIYSDEMDKMIDSTIFEDDPKCRAAMVHGMCIASMLTSRCEHVYVLSDNDMDTKPNKNWIFSRFVQHKEK